MSLYDWYDRRLGTASKFPAAATTAARSTIRSSGGRSINSGLLHGGHGARRRSCSGSAVAMLLNDKAPGRAFFRRCSTCRWSPAGSSSRCSSSTCSPTAAWSTGCCTTSPPDKHAHVVAGRALDRDGGRLRARRLEGHRLVDDDLPRRAAGRAERTAGGGRRWTAPTPGQRFRAVTLPAIRPAIAFVTVMLVIGGFNVFTSVLLMTGGRPARSDAGAAHLHVRAGVQVPRLRLRLGDRRSVLTLIVFVLSLVQLRAVPLDPREA